MTLLRKMIVFFVLVTAFLIINRNFLTKRGIDNEVVIAGNLILFVVSLAAYLITQRSLRTNNPQAFVRAMYGSFIIKFFVLAIAAFVYIQVTKKNVNKPALFVCMGLYVIYTAMEVGALIRLLRNKQNA